MTVPAQPPLACQVIAASAFSATAFQSIHAAHFKPSQLASGSCGSNRSDRLRPAGAFGDVYKATLDDVNSVAVKMLPSKQFSKQQLRAFLNEVRCTWPADSCGIWSASWTCVREGTIKVFCQSPA